MHLYFFARSVPQPGNSLETQRPPAARLSVNGTLHSMERHFPINKLSTLITPASYVSCATRIIWVPRICETWGVRTSENITNEPVPKVQLKKLGNFIEGP